MLRCLVLLGDVLLQGFPLSDQVADFPHQRLVSVDDRLRRFVIVVKTRLDHSGLELLDLRLTLSDASFEIGDAPLQRLACALPLLPFGVVSFALFARPRVTVCSCVRTPGFRLEALGFRLLALGLL